MFPPPLPGQHRSATRRVLCRVAGKHYPFEADSCTNVTVIVQVSQHRCVSFEKDKDMVRKVQRKCLE